MDESIMQEVLQRLVRLETLLETRLSSSDERIKRLEENQQWLWRTIIGTVIGGVIAFYFKA